MYDSLYVPIHDSSVEPSLMGMVLFGSWSCGKAMAEKPKAMPVLMVPSWATNEAKTCLTALPLRGGRSISGSSCAPLPLAIFSSFDSVDGCTFGSSAESTSDVFSGSCVLQFLLRKRNEDRLVTWKRINCHSSSSRLLRIYDTVYMI